MKKIQLVGSRSKADFAIYFSYVLTNLSKRVLLVDGTKDEIYRNGYTRLTVEEQVYDFQGIDILCGANSWKEVKELVNQIDEKLDNYDVVIVDMDSIQAINNDWEEFDHHFYVGDEERLNQIRDVELLHRLFDKTQSTEIMRVLFEGRYKLDSQYFEKMMDNRVTWASINYSIEVDDFESLLRTQMQHELTVPINKLSKQYREVLSEIVSGLFQVHVQDVLDKVKPSFIRFSFKKRKEQTQVAESRAY